MTPIDYRSLRPGHLIRRAQQIAVAIFMDECAGFDLTPVQYAALAAIAANRDIDATRLSYLVALDRSTIGTVLERLEAKGLVERAPSADDRRVKRLRIRAAGRRLLADVDEAVERAQQRIVAPLEADERRVFLRLLARLVECNNELSRAPARHGSELPDALGARS
ncbi:MAG: MarR family transcriptional regulator [Burkholderiaceae bacterium]|jgi:DNA-binding MarR family transcriptional regulator|nr:MarR family transcriptional regulator [Burkholderiaceae bacterium]